MKASCLLILLCSILMVIPAAPRAQAQATPYGGVLKVGWLTQPDTLNPFVTVLIQSFDVLSLTYDTLGNTRLT